jgi:hypothetical protein
MSIAVLQQCNPPDRLFSPLEGRIFDSVAQHGTCQEAGWKHRRVGTDQPEECWEEEERLNCALRAFEARGPMEGIPSKSIWNMKN